MENLKTLAETETDIQNIEKKLRREAAAGHDMLEVQSKELKSPLLLSLLLLVCAKFNHYELDVLETVAVGLELLDFGVRTHYRKGFEGWAQDKTDGNLSLIAGDYYYSKGILLASQLNKSFVVEIMAQAIVELTEAQAYLDQIESAVTDNLVEDHRASLLKRAALYGAGCELGGRLGGADPKIYNDFEQCGRLIGLLHGLSKGTILPIGAGHISKDNIDILEKEAKECIGKLPVNKYSAFLAELVEDLISAA